MKLSLERSRLSDVWILVMVILSVYMVSVVTAAEIPSARMEIPSETVRNVRETAVGNEMEMGGADLDDTTAEGLEADLLNYLFNKQILRRLRQQLPVTELQRKRSYWKQCAFNAVSCFGK